MLLLSAAAKPPDQSSRGGPHQPCVARGTHGFCPRWRLTYPENPNPYRLCHHPTAASHAAVGLTHGHPAITLSKIVFRCQLSTKSPVLNNIAIWRLRKVSFIGQLNNNNQMCVLVIYFSGHCLGGSWTFHEYLICQTWYRIFCIWMYIFLSIFPSTNTKNWSYYYKQ